MPCRILLITLALGLSLNEVTRAALTPNPPRPITHRVTVQLIQTALDDGSAPATVFGDAAQRAEIESNIELIWAQAGIDVQFLPSVNRFDNTFAYQGGPVAGPGIFRSLDDLSLINSLAQGAGVTNPDSSVINMFFVHVVPGWDLKSENWVNGVGNYGTNGIAEFVGSNALGTVFGRQHIAHWVSHELGHNLGLKHTPAGVNNLMGTVKTTDQLSDEQIAAMFQTTLRDDDVAFIPFGGTHFPKLLAPLPGDYDRNGHVDAADYVTLRHAMGTGDLVADGNGDGRVDVGDWDVWKINFGKTAAVASIDNIPDSGGVPEPMSSVLLLFAMLSLSATQRFRNRSTA